MLTAFFVDESKWPAMALGLAILAASALLFRHRRSALPTRRRVLAAMTLFFGVLIATMAFGHLLAVTIKLLSRTLEGSAPLFYALGLALIVPALWLAGHARRVLSSDRENDRATLWLNAWMALTLLAMGFHNLPLAAMAFFNVGYHLHSRPAVGWAIVGLAVLLNLGLFVGSLVFLASGQSFEQFGELP